MVAMLARCVSAVLVLIIVNFYAKYISLLDPKIQTPKPKATKENPDPGRQNWDALLKMDPN